MELQYIGGAIVALLVLGCSFLLRMSGRKRRSKGGSIGFQIHGNGEGHRDLAARDDVIIVGAGVVGSALAYPLGEDGRQVRVIERDLSEPDGIVGKLLQPGGYLKLAELCLEDCVKDIDSQQVFGYALFKDGKKTRIPYPLENFRSDVAGRRFHRGRFIQRLTEKASSLSNFGIGIGGFLVSGSTLDLTDVPMIFMAQGGKDAFTWPTWEQLYGN